jgi:hypothetical protein
MRSDKLKIEEIILLGEKVKQFYSDSVKLSAYISNSIGKSKKASKTIHTIYEKFGDLQHNLEVEFWKRIEKELINPTSCFYGKNKPIKKSEV